MSDFRRLGALPIVLVIAACGGSNAGPARKPADAGGPGAGGMTASGAAGMGGASSASQADAGSGDVVRDANLGSAGAGGGSIAAGARSDAGASLGGASSNGGANSASASATGGTGGIGTCVGTSCVDAGAGPVDPYFCEPYHSTCVGESMSFCNHQGTAIAAVVPCDPGDTCAVQGTNGRCTQQTCQVGTTCKDGSVVHTISCFANDPSRTKTFQKDIVITDCPSLGLTCGGSIQCVPKVCEPDSKVCKSSSVLRTCSSRGDQWLESSCAEPKECIAGNCVVPLCKPNQPTCHDSIATTCSADGMKYLDGGTPCAESGKFCHEGECLECWPTASFCSGATVRHCAIDGKSSTLSATCPETQACDPVTGMCKDKVCTPGEPACDGDRATTCNQDGSGYAAGGTSCADTGKHCHRGACAALACTPNAVYCSGKTVQRCAADGQSSSVVQTCGASEICDGVTLACKERLCTPGQTSCQGNWRMTCNEDGSDFEDVGHFCAGGSEGVCRDGECTRGVVSCEIGEYLCEGNLFMSCRSNAWAYPAEQCTDLQFCLADSKAESKGCRPRFCIPNQPACRGNNMTTCGPDGLSYLGEGVSCGSLYCVDGTCRDRLFIEDFEDANLVGWALVYKGELAKTTAVTSTHAAAGTRYSLVQTQAKTDSSVKRSFAEVRPKRIGWWAMAESRTTVSGAFALRSSQARIAKVQFHSDGTLVLEGSTSPLIVYEARRWYHMELRNLDYTARTFDVYVNDTLILAGARFRDESSSLPSAVSELELFTPAGTTVYWDEITFD